MKSKIVAKFQKSFQTASSGMQELWCQVAVFVLTLAALVPIFKTYFTRPNSHSYAFGGDALVLYYNMVYHVCYDHGSMLKGMNYPSGEYIYLTDAQGALANLLQWFSHHFFDISGYVVGIVHSLNLYLIPVCSLLVYQIFKAMGVRRGIGIPFAVLISIMAPQVLRLKGHFGLAYPFLIPLALLWFLRKYRLDGRLEWRDLGLLAVLIFFSYNNPYVGFGAAGLLMVSGGLLTLKAIFYQKNLRTGLLAFGIGLVSQLLPFLDFHFNDPVADRVAQQFGFFHYRASLDGLLMPPGSLWNHLIRISGIYYGQEIRVESWMNLGLVASGLFAALTVFGLARFFSKSAKKSPSLLPSSFKFLLAGSVLLYLLAANYSLYGWAKDWMESHLGPLLMFKASGRIGWSFYYTATISAIVFLDYLLRKINRKGLATGIVLLLLAVWGLEYNLYIGVHFRKVFHENNFDEKHQEALLKQLQENQVNLEDYSAILTVPRMMAWSDLFRSELNWAAQFYSLRISAATGLPLLNAMLSRISTGQAAEGVQLTSHPIIEKERLGKLPNRKDILLVLGSGYKSLSEGEQHLIDLAQPVLKDKFYSLYRLNLDKLEQSQALQVENARSQFQKKDKLSSENTFHLNFENEKREKHFYGKGAHLVLKGNSVVADFHIPIQVDTQYIFSVWHYIDFSRYDLGRWQVSVRDSLGKVVSSKVLDGIEGNDVQLGWIRTEALFEVPKHGSIQLEIESSRNIYVDELLLRPAGDTVIYDLPNEPDFLWNGYKVNKKRE